MRPIELPSHAAQALALLEQAGFEAWCVGGCVRDSLLGRTPGDWDVTTSALPEQTQSALSSFPTYDVGARHGTVTALIHGQPVEITTYRADGPYADHRHPDQVRFSRDLEDDLSRRDFTVNAMAWHPRRGLADPFGGQADLDAKILRCVGDPARRFDEDALRILRCLRFAATLGFSIEAETARALTAQRSLLGAVSGERIREELTRLLCGAGAADVLRDYSEVVFTVLPELAPMKGCAQETRYHCWDVWEHSLHAVEAVPPSPVLRWAALLHDSGKPSVKFYGEDGTAHFYGHPKVSGSIGEAVCRRLRFSNEDREAVVTLVTQHETPLNPPEKRVRRLLASLGPERFFQLLDLKRADSAAHAPAYRQERIGFANSAQALAEEILARKEPLSLGDLAVRGDDLLALGIPKGPEIGGVLHALLDGVLDGTLPNEREALLAEAGRIHGRGVERFT